MSSGGLHLMVSVSSLQNRLFQLLILILNFKLTIYNFEQQRITLNNLSDNSSRDHSATPQSVKPIGHTWVFHKKPNENNEVIRHKSHLVVQGCSQRTRID
ncbi:hypothetical protein OSB04_002372 [Centaurea solstitialis]|uniref:Reverse transcriptase Ty1/copia-type domain-containing protein n=1 Tax=Centaurea solstitialis TaxID=347529 RepID=A0AA38WVA8_9ASTR|nr:hypothetical protein OSB04_002372 [Centaurea solstitialis]